MRYDESTVVNQVRVGVVSIKDTGEIICNNPAIRGNLAHLRVKENVKIGIGVKGQITEGERGRLINVRQFSFEMQ